MRENMGINSAQIFAPYRTRVSIPEMQQIYLFFHSISNFIVE